jgi:ribosome recycling factor
MAAKSNRSAGGKRRSGPAMSPAEKAAYGDIKQGVRHVEKSIGEVRKGLRKAEKAIEADARVRIRELRKEAKAQLASLEAKRREASRLMKNLSAAAEGAWQDVKQSADQVLAEARATASSIADRIRTALQR